ncbi:hypothetical protein BN8_03699 [Fibrisoma limi BUZ 3]|uniref:Uncharacterized protein n=1 Tax=Fibrisoma limi BUZ 3 TaxID=1185876 RepID=I2GKU3_9BACT|nr:hypothetical protein [Fibrisoma limi]CCH54519.1 hypothetical protein BN8_03699 [Fibrisoma limi BUZ 3]
MGELIFLAIAGPVIWYAIATTQKRSRQEDQLREAYHQALRSGDKALALQRGRDYYGFMRRGKLTIYDEQAIANDLSTMV